MEDIEPEHNEILLNVQKFQSDIESLIKGIKKKRK